MGRALLIAVALVAVFFLGAALQRWRLRRPEISPGAPRETRWLNSDLRALEARLRRLEQEMDALKGNAPRR
jgi:hypothetical protein